MPTRLRNEEELEAAFEAPSFLLFKHSPTCPTSAGAFLEYERWAEEHPSCSTGWIEVVHERSLARAVAERTGIRHESPQAIWLVAGEPRWHASHSRIHKESLQAAVAQPAG